MIIHVVVTLQTTLVSLMFQINLNIIQVRDLTFCAFLWFLISGTTTRQFVGHTKDVLSVAFSADNRQIVSGSRDNTIKLWNTLGQCKYTIQVGVMSGGKERYMKYLSQAS